MKDINIVQGTGVQGNVFGAGRGFNPKQDSVAEVFIREGAKIANSQFIREANKKRVKEIAEARAEIATGAKSFEEVAGEEKAKWWSPLITSARLEGARTEQALSMFTKATTEERKRVGEYRALSQGEYQKVLSKNYESYLTGDEEVDVAFMKMVEPDRVRLAEIHAKENAVFALEEEAIATLDFAKAMKESLDESDDSERREFVSGKVSGLLASRIGNKELLNRVYDVVAMDTINGDDFIYKSLVGNPNIGADVRKKLVSIKEASDDFRYERSSKEFRMKKGKALAELDAMLKNPKYDIKDYIAKANMVGEEFGLPPSFYEGVGKEVFNHQSESFKDILEREEREARFEESVRSGNIELNRLEQVLETMIDSGSYKTKEELIQVRRLIASVREGFNNKDKMVDTVRGIDNVMSGLSKLVGSREQLVEIEKRLISGVPPSVRAKIRKSVTALAKYVDESEDVIKAYGFERVFTKAIKGGASKEELEAMVDKAGDSGEIGIKQIISFRRKIDLNELEEEEREKRIRNDAVSESLALSADDYSLPVDAYKKRVDKFLSKNKVSESTRRRLMRKIVDKQRRDGEISLIIGQAVSGESVYVEGALLEDVYEKIDSMPFESIEDKASVVSMLPPDPKVVNDLGMQLFSISSAKSPSSSLIKNLELVSEIEKQAGRKVAIRYFGKDKMIGNLLLDAMKVNEPEEAYMTVASFNEAVDKKSKVQDSVGFKIRSRDKAKKISRAVKSVVSDNDLSGSGYYSRLVESAIEEEVSSILVESPGLYKSPGVVYDMAESNVGEMSFGGVFGMTEELANKGSLKYGDIELKEKILKSVSIMNPSVKMRDDYEVVFVDGMVVLYPYDDEGEPILSKPYGVPLSDIELNYRKSKYVIEESRKVEAVRKIEEMELKKAMGL